MNRAQLLVGASVLAIATATPVLAQQQEAVESVVVTASRINIAGYQAPTPVTVMSADQLQRDAMPDLGDEIRELPSVGTATSPNSGTNAGTRMGTQGLDLINLRDLGILRTLVLFDGERVVNANVNGGVDMLTIPTTLVQRVDIVTGGASAAWGSDAVAGVVNIVLNKSFSGLAANLEGSSTDKADLTSEKAEASFGTDFAGTRGHFIVSAAYTTSPNALYATDRNYDWNDHLLANPAYNGGANGQPKYIHGSATGTSGATQGGLILGCGTVAAPTAQVTCPLTNTQFIGPNAAPATYVPGLISGPFATGSSAESAVWGTNYTTQLNAPYRTFTFFNFERYNLTDNVTASLELNYGKDFSILDLGPLIKTSVSIASNNAYLPPSIAAEMAAQGYSNIFIGSTNLNGFTLSDPYGGVSTVATNSRQLFRGVFSLDGSISDDWTWNAYAEHGQSRVMSASTHNVNEPNYLNAVNAVTVTAANVGNSGLGIGSIACASTLTNPTNGCVPLDIFGTQNPSAGAVNYITNTSLGGGNFGLQVLNQDVFAGSVQGQLPAEWSLPAGRIALTLGAESRKEGAVLTSDPLSKTTAYYLGNFTAYSGHYIVTEGYGEVIVPLLKNNLVQSLDFNAAGRVTDYSTSGMVETWKLGATSQVNDDLRLRSTWSFDIRAPDIAELFSAASYGMDPLINPYTKQSVFGYEVTSGNANLKPEEASTVTGGVVLTPHWVEGLTLSADWYSISISKAIASFSASTITTLCGEGQQVFCNLVYFQNGIMYENLTPINANHQTDSGLDFQGDYNFPFMGGSLDLRLVGNYTDEETQLALGTYFDYAGSIGSDSAVVGFPKARGTLSATYEANDWQATVQGRFIGAAVLNNAWGPLQVDNNNVPAVAYLDLRGAYDLFPGFQLYGAIDNVTDVPPPVVASTTAVAGTGQGTIYDAIGRMFRAGIRLRY
jgi:outer membrane receptor protein involved in Fe transport